MKHLIHDITERGQLYQMKQKWQIEKPDCTPSLKNIGNPLTMGKLTTAFIVILGGIVLALVSFLLEIVFKSFVPTIFQQHHISKNDLKLRICLNELKAGHFKSRYPELITLITDVENYLAFDKMQPSSMY